MLAEMRPGEAEELLRVATGLDEPERMINLLLEAGLRIEAAGVRCDAVDERRVAEASDRFASVLGLRESGPSRGEGIRLSKDHGRRRVGTGSDVSVTSLVILVLHAPN